MHLLCCNNSFLILGKNYEPCRDMYKHAYSKWHEILPDCLSMDIFQQWFQCLGCDLYFIGVFYCCKYQQT